MWKPGGATHQTQCRIDLGSEALYSSLARSILFTAANSILPCRSRGARFLLPPSQWACTVCALSLLDPRLFPGATCFVTACRLQCGTCSAPDDRFWRTVTAGRRIDYGHGSWWVLKTVRRVSPYNILFTLV